MPETLTLSAVRHFADDLNERIRQCDNGERMVCSTLENRINHYVTLCAELRRTINRWARDVFTGQIECDPEVENLLKTQAAHLLRRAKETAALGRALYDPCFSLQGLPDLHGFIADFDYLLEKWVSPRRAVSPAPRMKLPDAARQQIVERMSKLQPLPGD